MGDAVSQTVARPPTTSSLQKSRTQIIFWGALFSEDRGRGGKRGPDTEEPGRDSARTARSHHLPAGRLEEDDLSDDAQLVDDVLDSLIGVVHVNKSFRHGPHRSPQYLGESEPYSVVGSISIIAGSLPSTADSGASPLGPLCSGSGRWRAQTQVCRLRPRFVVPAACARW